MSKILAFDQALNVSGYSIFKDGELSSFGKLTTDDGVDIGIKLKQIREFAINLIDDEKPTEVAIEEIQLQQIPGSTAHGNVETYKKLAYVQSVLIEVFAEKGIKYTVVPSVAWKSTCGVKGRARAEQKRNAQTYVLEKYGVKAIQDIVDSICIGEHIVEKSNKEINWD